MRYFHFAFALAFLLLASACSQTTEGKAEEKKEEKQEEAKVFNDQDIQEAKKVIDTIVDTYASAKSEHDSFKEDEENTQVEELLDDKLSSYLLEGEDTSVFIYEHSSGKDDFVKDPNDCLQEGEVMDALKLDCNMFLEFDAEKLELSSPNTEYLELLDMHVLSIPFSYGEKDLDDEHFLFAKLKNDQIVLLEGMDIVVIRVNFLQEDMKEIGINGTNRSLENFMEHSFY